MEVFKNVNYKCYTFEVSNYGRVKRLKRDEIRATYKNTSGYEYFTTLKHAILVHRLVAIAFIPNPEGKDYVNHKDGNKFNNHVSNLEWVTKSENELHSVRVLGNKRNLEGLKKAWVDCPNKIPVSLYTKDGQYIADFESGKACAEYLNCSISGVSSVLRKYNHTIKGHIVKYKI